MLGTWSRMGTVPMRAPSTHHAAWLAVQRPREKSGFWGRLLPKFQFLLINIISAPVQVDEIALSEEPVSLPVPNDAILTGSDGAQRPSSLLHDTGAWA